MAAAMLIAGALLTAGEDPRRLAGPSSSFRGKLKRVQGPDRY